MLLLSNYRSFKSLPKKKDHSNIMFYTMLEIYVTFLCLKWNLNHILN